MCALFFFGHDKVESSYALRSSDARLTASWRVFLFSDGTTVGSAYSLGSTPRDGTCYRLAVGFSFTTPLQSMTCYGQTDKWCISIEAPYSRLVPAAFIFDLTGQNDTSLLVVWFRFLVGTQQVQRCP